MTDLYTVELTVKDDTTPTHVFPDLSEGRAQDLLVAFLAESGVHTLGTYEGVFTWYWDDISSCKVTRQPTERKETR